MKLCVIGSKERYEKFMPECSLREETEIVYFPLNTENEEILKSAADADVVFADAIAKVDRDLIEGMKNLKLVHSEGVAYNGIDLVTATKQNVMVCNCKGINKTAVAEQAILLMLSLLRMLPEGNEAVLAGQQIKRKEYLMVNGIEELEEQVVGLIGFGDIAKETAKRLYAFGTTVYYYSRHRMEKRIEDEYHVTYLPLEELLHRSTMVSLHVPVTEETKEMVNQEFLNKMKDGAYLINTARGELVENEALKAALLSGKLKGVGLDTIAPEPVTLDNPLLTMPEEAKKKLICSPHMAGITTATFRRGHKTMWDNASRVMKGENPINIVNDVHKS